MNLWKIRSLNRPLHNCTARQQSGEGHVLATAKADSHPLYLLSCMYSIHASLFIFMHSVTFSSQLLLLLINIFANSFACIATHEACPMRYA